jgi:hypothetical protein
LAEAEGDTVLWREWASTYLLLFLLTEGGRPHGSWKLKLITPPLRGKGFHTLLFFTRPFPHGVLDTSAKSIPNFGIKNKMLTHFLAYVRHLYMELKALKRRLNLR